MYTDREVGLVSSHADGGGIKFEFLLIDEGLIGQHHHIIKTTHPAYASYTKQPWDCNDMYNQINKNIIGQNGPEFKINW